MEEAKHSLNFKFMFRGYESQLTLRSDEDGRELIDRFTVALDYLASKGASPTPSRNGYNGGNGKAATGADLAVIAKPPEPEPVPEPQPRLDDTTAPICRKCKSPEHMELIDFFKDGKNRHEWKCQVCEAWHYAGRKK